MIQKTAAKSFAVWWPDITSYRHRLMSRSWWSYVKCMNDKSYPGCRLLQINGLGDLKSKVSLHFSWSRDHTCSNWRDFTCAESYGSKDVTLYIYSFVRELETQMIWTSLIVGRLSLWLPENCSSVNRLPRCQFWGIQKIGKKKLTFSLVKYSILAETNRIESAVLNFSRHLYLSRRSAF